MIVDHFLDQDFEYKLLKLVLGEKHTDVDGTITIDARFGQSNIHLLDENLFSTGFARQTVEIIKSYYNKFRSIPTYSQVMVEMNTSQESSIRKREFHNFLNKTVYTQSTTISIIIPTSNCQS